MDVSDSDSSRSVSIDSSDSSEFNFEINKTMTKEIDSNDGIINEVDDEESQISELMELT